MMPQKMATILLFAQQLMTYKGYCLSLNLLMYCTLSKKNMVLKIEDYFFGIEDFRSEFCSKNRGLIGPILAKKVLYKKKSVIEYASYVGEKLLFQLLFPPAPLGVCQCCQDSGFWMSLS